MAGAGENDRIEAEAVTVTVVAVRIAMGIVAGAAIVIAAGDVTERGIATAVVTQRGIEAGAVPRIVTRIGVAIGRRSRAPVVRSRSLTRRGPRRGTWTRSGPTCSASSRG
jgi:hypothetical protein